MSTSDVVNELTLAEAAAWLSQLQEADRSAAIDAAFNEWLAARPAHAKAFTRVSDVWGLIPRAAKLAPAPVVVRDHRPRRHLGQWLAASTCAVLLIALASALWTQFPAKQVYQTAVGGRQVVVLNDNTHITLNTNTRLIVSYRRSERRVQLERGEALFDVIRNPARPFIVQAGNAETVDLGTRFDVRDGGGHVAVTLLEGKVRIIARPGNAGRPLPEAVLVPGERLTIYSDGAGVLDRPNLAQALAWRHGQVYFDDSTLADAVAELSRYGGTPIRIADPAIASLHVSGVFRTRDSAEFASAVANLHHLQATHDDGAIVLTR